MTGSNTVVRILRILDLISKSNNHLTGAEISYKIDIPAYMTHDILITLLDENVIYYKDFNKKICNWNKSILIIVKLYF